jgi:hypothetical protein
MTTLQIAIVLGLFLFAPRVARNARAHPASGVEVIA